MEQTKYDVFISYSRKDYVMNDEVIPGNPISAIQEMFDKNGIKYWFDKEVIYGGEEFVEVIADAIANSKMLVFVSSVHSNESVYTAGEILEALDGKKLIIPVRIDDCSYNKKFRILLRPFDFIDYKAQPNTALTDLLRTVSKEKVRKSMLDECNEAREQFWGTMKAKDYNRFVTDVMKRYYGQEFMMNINHREFGIVCVPSRLSSSVTSITEFDYLCDFENSKLSGFNVNEHQGYTRNKWYAEYSAIIEGKIHHPNRPGYMLDKIIVNSDGYFEKMRVHVGTYAENVYSTHVLEYELYLAYKEYCKNDLNNPDIWTGLKNSLCIRNKMHEDVDINDEYLFKRKMYESLLSGSGRDSLLSVQMLVIIKSKRSKKYEVKIVQRSNEVAIKPGIYQFVPAGGFEILNDSDDNIYDDGELVDNFSPGCAVFREYLEELFSRPEFEGGGNGSIEERLLKDPCIIAIEDMLETGTASLHFLGSVIELAGLRHELSFVLILHEDAYARIPLITNEECKKGMLKSIPVERFNQENDIWANIHGPSAAMWHMFQQTALYQSLVNANG